MEHTGTDHKTYNVQFYNLDAVISVGYRVNSIKATHFRIRATKILKEYIQKGFVLDDERLKQGESTFGNEFLEFRKYKILDNKGKISHEIAEEKAIGEYEKFNKIQKIGSDFDKLIQKIRKE